MSKIKVRHNTGVIEFTPEELSKEIEDLNFLRDAFFRDFKPRKSGAIKPSIHKRRIYNTNKEDVFRFWAIPKRNYNQYF